MFFLPLHADNNLEKIRELYANLKMYLKIILHLLLVFDLAIAESKDTFK